MPRVLCSLALIAFTSLWAPRDRQTKQSLGGLSWNRNPAVEQITVYRVYRVTGNHGTLEGETSAATFRPAKKGSYYVTAVNFRGESKASVTVKL